MDYIFLLGRNPELSILEIAAYLKRKRCPFTFRKRTEQIAIIDASFMPPTAIKELGGTVLIARQQALEEITFEKNKILYALITLDEDGADFKEEFKAVCQEQKVKATQKYGGREIPSPSLMAKLDYVFLVYKHKTFLADQLSNPKEYEERDETRPVFDPVAVTSIRLAKILINLAEAQQEILDPFCGTGTILQEALLMKYHVIGVDKKIQDARKNLSILPNAQKVRLIEGDARHLSKLVLNVESVVTEPYMGPYLKKLPTDQEAAAIIMELTDLYQNVLAELARVVQGKIVMIVPRIRTFKAKYEVPMAQLLKRAGLRVVSPVPSITVPLFYPKKKSKVERFIYILEKAT